MRFDRAKFIASYTAAFGAPTQAQTDGLNEILAAAEADAQISDIRWLAYMLATVKHECADRWKPIEEFGKGKGRKYGNPVTVTDPAGKQFTNVYYGRGYVQLTWDWNYRQFGSFLKNRLLYEPQLALDADIAYQIMSYGMRNGSFTGARLGRFINDAGCDYVNARKIINGMDQAQRIAGYATKLEKVLRDSVIAAVPGGVPALPQTGPAPQPAPAAGGASFIVATTLNIRSGPAASNAAVAGSPLPKGTVVTALADQGGWKQVRAQGTVNGVADVTGWVAAQFLQPAPATAGV
ncbi:SH3 domain-containing protein [Longimicrobium sp.]|uniref:SH3 domain-containing protein n=1 Tax=Longimicrobium sp. TaxID=2029185 RepID=UPI002C9122C6|nr:SH3 domain-containing protein [Longimicrobium sp.]HSU15333.1 SH3 domain-containing protein [Longimicrobium sp.]